MGLRVSCGSRVSSGFGVSGSGAWGRGSESGLRVSSRSRAWGELWGGGSGVEGLGLGLRAGAWGWGSGLGLGVGTWVQVFGSGPGQGLVVVSRVGNLGLGVWDQGSVLVPQGLGHRVEGPESRVWGRASRVGVRGWGLGLAPVRSLFLRLGVVVCPRGCFLRVSSRIGVRTRVWGSGAGLGVSSGVGALGSGVWCQGSDVEGPGSGLWIHGSGVEGLRVWAWGWGSGLAPGSRVCSGGQVLWSVPGVVLSASAPGLASAPKSRAHVQVSG